MATAEQRQELQEKLEHLVASQFGGDYRKAFVKYANRDAKIHNADLLTLLADAGVGNWLTRGMWAKGILGELDRDNDGAISLAEFEAVLK